MSKHNGTNPGEPLSSTFENSILQCLIRSSAFYLPHWIGQILLLLLPTLGALVSYGFMPERGGMREEIMKPILFWSIVIFAAAQLGYFIYQILRRKGTPALIYAVVSLFCIAWMMMSILIHEADFYLQAEDSILFVCGLISIPVFYSMINLVRQLLSRSGSTIERGLIPLVGIPLIWYLLVNTVMLSASGTIAVIVLLLTIAATYFFIFLLFYVLFLIGKSHARIWRVLRFLLVFILPILCFVVTQTGEAFSFFWDYTSFSYYLLIIANGVLLFLPEPRRKALRLLLFFARCSMYLIVTYFFVVIAPFYSLSLVGLLLAGLGLLVLTPLFLWSYQTKAMFASAKSLWKDCGKWQTIACFAAGIALVPLVMTGVFLVERQNLDTAVRHMNSLNDSSGQSVRIDSDMLRSSLRYIQSDQRMRIPDYEAFARGDYRYYGEQTRILPPFITSFHNKVIDADKFLAMMGQNRQMYNDLIMLYVNTDPEVYPAGDYSGYYDDPYDELIPDDWDFDDEDPEDLPPVQLEDIMVQTRQEGDYYRSFVHLTLKDTRSDEDDSLIEYSTNIALPEGVFVSDYYLDVFGSRKQGLLVETTSANWIYNVVTSRFLDPGLVQYTNGGISLNVFPFSPQETRFTGIEFLHRESVSLIFDGKTAELAPEAQALTQPVEGENLIFISEQAKEALLYAEREPYYLFVVDCSYKSDVETLAARLEEFVLTEQIAPAQASVSAVNFNRQTWNLEEDWKKSLLRFPREGGFAYGLMTDQLFREVDQSRYYPVLVVLESHGSPQAIEPRNSNYLMQSSPETAGYFTIGEDSVYYRAYDNHSREALEMLPEARPVKLLDTNRGRLYLDADSGAEIYYFDTYDSVVSMPSGNLWMDALNFTGDTFRIERINDQETQFAAMLELLKKSFSAHVMSPYSSFIVLETQEQEEAMLRRQEMLMQAASWDDFYETAQDISFEDDADEEPDDGAPATSEPGLLLCIALFVPLAILYRMKRIRQRSC